MTPGSGPLRRLAAMACLLLHFLVGGLAPLADARAEASSRAAYDHVEASRESACTPVHDHLHCAFCRVLADAGTAPAAPPLRLAASLRRAAGAPRPQVRFVPPAHVSSLGSRAPPAA
ncbi:MAG: hypothetical protein AB1941_08370 [Gemmatimonadota bacterium]